MQPLRMSMLLLVAMAWLAPTVTAGDEKDPAPKIDPTVISFLDALQSASRSEDPGAMVPLWDMEEAVRSLERAGFLVSVPAPRLAKFKARTRLALTRTLARRPWLAPFKTFNVRRVSKGEHPNTISVYAWLYTPDGAYFRIRLHLVRRAESWALFDLEDPERALRTLHIFGLLLVEAVDGVPPAWVGAGAEIRRVEEFLVAGERESARELLVELEAKALPDVLACNIELMLAAVTLELGDLGAALGYLDELAAMGGSAPIQHYMRAAIYNQQALWEEALAEARRYIALLDAGPDVTLELALALRALGRIDEALEALTPAVREHPEDADLLVQYACCLPEAKWSELEARFARLPDPAASVRLAAELCVAEGLGNRLRLFVSLLRMHAPKHYDVAYFEGHALHIEGKYREAADRFERAQTAVLALPESERLDEYEQSIYVDSLLDALLAAGDAVGACDRAHDRAYALEYVAESLLEDEKGVLLRTFLAHAQAHLPEDGAELLGLRVRYYRAKGDVLAGQHAGALQALTVLRPTVEKLLDPDDEDDVAWWLLYQVESELIRLLLREKRHAEAHKVVAHITERDGPDYLLLALVLAAKGEVAEVKQLIRKAVAEEEWTARVFFEEPDLDRLLRGPAYADLRRELLGEK